MAFLLRRVRIDRQGYERDGTYWGTGAPLFEYETPSGDIDYLRASSRDSAKAKVIKKYPEYDTKKARKEHVTSSQIGGLFNPGGILKKLRKGVRGHIKLSRGRLIIKT